MRQNIRSTFNAFGLSLDIITRHKLAVLALFLFVLYFSNNAYVLSGDAVPAALLPWALLDEHTVVLDDFTGFIITQWTDHYFVAVNQGHLVSIYPIVTPVMAVPFYIPEYVMAALTGRTAVDFSDAFIFATGYSMKFASVTFAVLGVAVFYLLLRKLFDERWAFILSLAYGVCTSTWTISSQSLWQHGTAQLLIICCYYLLIRDIGARKAINALGMGALSALIFFNRPSDVVFLLPPLYYALKEKYWQFIPAFIVAGLPFFLYNMFFFGSILGGYGSLMGPGSFTVTAGNYTPTPTSLDSLGYAGKVLGRFIESNLVLFLYTPLALLSFLGMMNVLGKDTLKGVYKEIHVAFILSLLLTDLILGLFNNTSGWGYGPRYWTDALPLIMVFVGWSKADSTLYKAGFLCLALISFAIQAYGAYVYLPMPY